MHPSTTLHRPGLTARAAGRPLSATSRRAPSAAGAGSSGGSATRRRSSSRPRNRRDATARRADRASCRTPAQPSPSHIAWRTPPTRDPSSPLGRVSPSPRSARESETTRRTSSRMRASPSAPRAADAAPCRCASPHRAILVCRGGRFVQSQMWTSPERSH